MKVVLSNFNQNSDLIVYSYGYEDVSKDAHWGYGYREKYILHYVIEGEGYFNDIKVKKGQGFLIEPKKLHEYHSSTNNPWKYFWVIFDCDVNVIKEKFVKVDENNVFNYIFNDQFLSLVDMVISNSEKISINKALGYFYLLMDYNLNEESINVNSYVDRAKEFIRLNFYRNVSVKEVADYVGLSDRYLYNLFIKYADKSPKEFLCELKLEKAKRLLLNSNYTVSEIAISCGFSDVLSFSKYFSKKVGLSPTSYRNEKSNR